MPSSYKRDDKDFRAKITALADAGLRFPTASGESFIGDAAPARIIEPPTRKVHFGFNLPGLVAGLVWWSPFAAIGIVLIHWLLGGAR